MAFNPFGKKQNSDDDYDDSIPETLNTTSSNPTPYDPENYESIKDSARKQTLKTLNALKIMQPIFVALMERPGLDSDSKELSNSFSNFILEISKSSDKVCAKIGVDVNDERNLWIKNVFERVFSQYYKDEWTKNGSLNSDFLEKLVDLSLEQVDKFTHDIPFENVGSKVNVQTAVMKAMIPWLKEAKEFDFFRDIDKDIEEVGEKLFSAAEKGVEVLATENASKKDKVDLFRLLIGELGELYATSWKSESKRILEIMSKLSQEEVEKKLQKYPNGLPRTKIDVDFDRYFEKLIVVTEKLVSSKNKVVSENKNKTPQP